MGTKKDSEKLIYAALLQMATIGGKPTSGGHSFALRTPRAGVVVLRAEVDELKRGYTATISLFIQFENNLAARDLGFDCNMFSGKWNHHFLKTEDEIEAVFKELRDKAFD